MNCEKYYFTYFHICILSVRCYQLHRQNVYVYPYRTANEKRTTFYTGSKKTLRHSFVPSFAAPMDSQNSQTFQASTKLSYFLFKRFEAHNKTLLRMIKWITGNNLIIVDQLSTRRQKKTIISCNFKTSMFQYSTIAGRKQTPQRNKNHPSNHSWLPTPFYNE